MENETRYHFRPRRRPHRSAAGSSFIVSAARLHNSRIEPSRSLRKYHAHSRKLGSVEAVFPSARPKIINSTITHLDGRRRRRFDTTTTAPALAGGQLSKARKIKRRRAPVGRRRPSGTYTSTPRRNPCLPALSPTV